MSWIPSWSISQVFWGLIGMVTDTWPMGKSRFVPERDIPDLTGKVTIVTGGNSGIGKETAKQLLLHNAKVYIACRSEPKAREAIDELKATTGKEAIFLEMDLSSLASVTKAAEEFKSKESSLHVLFNSAGVMLPPMEQLTDDGYDLQFGTNALGHAHFTLELLPELILGAKSSPDQKARVVFVSSCAIYLAEPIAWSALDNSDPLARRKLGSLRLYLQSKVGVTAFCNELARRYADQGIVSNSLNPGSIATNLAQHTGFLFKWAFKTFLWEPSYGAITSLYVGTSPEAINYNGQYFIPWARPGDQGRLPKDPELGTQLWDWIHEQRKKHISSPRD